MRQDVLDKAISDPRGVPARILDAAEDVFGAVGFAGASTREIARRAKVPFGALHYYWGSKQLLSEAVEQRIVARFRETVMRNVAPSADVAEMLGRLSDVFFDLLAENKSATRFMLRGLLEPLNPNSEQVFGTWKQFGISTFRQLGVNDQLDIEAVALLLTATFLGAVAAEGAQELVLGNTIFASPAIRRRVRRQLRIMVEALLAARH